jgi:PDZ domain-containing protein
MAGYGAMTDDDVLVAVATPSERRRRSRLAVAALALAALVLVAAIVASFWQLPDYAIVPGTALNAGSLVTVPKDVRQAHSGSVWLTDVDLVQLRAIDYLLYRFNSDDSIEPAAAVTGPATPAQYFNQGTIDMATARQAATVVGLQALGYHVRAVPTGVIVYQPVPGSPASNALADNDVIVALDGHPVTTWASLTEALHDPAPGTEVRVVVHAYGVKTTHEVTVRLGEERIESIDGQSYLTCVPMGTRTSLRPYDVNGKPYGCLGLDPEISEIDYVTTGLPFAVSLDPDGIIGPSAGLAYTLALMQELDPDDLTGGHMIAATGTMSVTGQVGDVGGVAQKTVAVRNAGATVFFVPTPELATARAHAGGQLRIFAVSSMSQVLSDLRSLGGRIATPPSAATH